MKLIKYSVIMFLLPVLATSCKKEINGHGTVSSLNVVNASVSAPDITVNFTFSPIPYSQFRAPLYYGSSSLYSNPTGNLPVELISSADTLHAFYKNTLNLPAGSIHTLYVCGSSDNPETMLLEDHIPYHAEGDSTSSVRFINLSPNSKPVTINLQGNPPSQAEFSGLAYKHISSFKTYTATYKFKDSGYTFEIRDAASGTLLTTFTWNFRLFFCNTLVIDGLENDSSGNFPVSVIQVNHYY